jgi:hypothetical protein
VPAVNGINKKLYVPRTPNAQFPTPKAHCSKQRDESRPG